MSTPSSIEINGTEYEIKEQIGSGGSGDVFRAISNSKTFAIKRIKLFNELNENNKQNKNNIRKNKRFRNEIAFCSKDHSKHIIKTLGSILVKKEPSAKSDHSYLWYVMPYYKCSLREKIKEDISLDCIFKLLLQLYAAVEYIHNCDVVHRDIKPENILIDEKGSLVLADFGIAHFKDNSITKASDILANRFYYAPEQSKGYDPHGVGAAADVFAVGLITNEFFTKQKPMGGRFQRVSASYAFLSDLDILITRMTDQNPMQRISIGAAKRELERIYLSFKKDLKSAKGALLCNTENPISNKMLDQAAEDLIIANSLLKRLSSDEWDNYNLNYHCNIHFTTDSNLQNAVICSLLLEACTQKFNYEANAYKTLASKGRPQEYDARPSEKQCKHLDNKLRKYSFSLPDYRGSKNSSSIQKYFFSCCDYHCQEILKNIDATEKSVAHNLEDAPVLWIAKFIALNAPELLDPIETFNLWDYVSIIPELSNDSQRDNVFENLRENNIQVHKANEILNKFQNLWSNVYCYTNGSEASIFFTNGAQYENFQNYAKQIAKGDFVFEGDVLDILKPIQWNNTLIQLKLSVDFDVLITLAKIVESKPVKLDI